MPIEPETTTQEQAELTAQPCVAVSVSPDVTNRLARLLIGRAPDLATLPLDEAVARLLDARALLQKRASDEKLLEAALELQAVERAVRPLVKLRSSTYDAVHLLVCDNEGLRRRATEWEAEARKLHAELEKSK